MRYSGRCCPRRCFFFVAAFWLLTATGVSAQDFIGSTAEKWNKAPMINDSSMAILATFAREWDRLSIGIARNDERKIQKNWTVFGNTKPEDVGRLLKLFASNNVARAYFEHEDVKTQFQRIYQHAARRKSVIANISKTTLLEYWVVTKVITDRKTVGDVKQWEKWLKNRMFLKWCIWILWPCTPPPPSPQ